MNDSSDFVRTHTRSGGISTSVEAAEIVAASVEERKDAILQVLADAGEDGLINEQIAKLVGAIVKDQFSDFRARRLYDLRMEGKARHHPDGLKRKNEAGRQCIVWVLGDDPNKGSSRKPSSSAKDTAALQKALLHISDVLLQKYTKGEDLKVGSKDFLACLRWSRTRIGNSK